jgi:hypothetical protein
MDSQPTLQEFCEGIGEVCSRLTQLGMTAEANRVSDRLHKIAWRPAGTMGELLRDLYSQFKAILASPGAGGLPSDVKDALANYVTIIAGWDTLRWAPEVGPPLGELSGRKFGKTDPPPLSE